MMKIEFIHESPPCNEFKLKEHIYDLLEVMIPPLENRVDINSYIHKIASFADVIYAKLDGIIIGSCAVYLNSEEGFITSIGVLEPYMGIGVGTLLLDKAIKLSREKKIDSVSLKVHVSNKKAFNFYIKNGFKVADTIESWFIMKINIH